jgi:hypothetical protein
MKGFTMRVDISFYLGVLFMKVASEESGWASGVECQIGVRDDRMIAVSVVRCRGSCKFCTTGIRAHRVHTIR